MNMVEKKIVIYVGNFSFPYGNAAGKRVYANGKILRELGYEVLFIGMDKEVSGKELLKDTQNDFDEFKYYNFKYPLRKLDWMRYSKNFNKFIEFISSEKIEEKIKFIIFYGSPGISLFNKKLIEFCKIRDIKVIADCVEWFTTKTSNFIFNAIKWADNTYQMTCVNKKADGVIAISSYLANYYKKSKCRTVVIPPLSPVEYIFSKSNLKNDKIITYAGIPFRKGQKLKDCSTLKDRIDKTIAIFHQAKLDGCEFIFNIYGLTEAEYLKAIPQQKTYIDELGASVVFHGIKTNMEVIDSVIDSDFTILIRDVNRGTTAGFPTKVSESISCGTPVITTKTSDLEDYIIEGVNGFYIDIYDQKQAVKKIINIINIEKANILTMKEYCQNNNSFYYKHYISRMEDFIQQALDDYRRK